MNNLDADIIKKEEELKELIHKQKMLIEEKKQRQKAIKYFDKHFEMDMSHDIHIIDEYWGQKREQFINQFTDDDYFNDIVLMRLREDYVIDVKEEKDILQTQYDRLSENLEEAKKVQNKKDNKVKK